jgi:hypothetical protein
MKKQNNESFLEFAERLLSSDSVFEYGLQEIYSMLFGESVSYDNAQRQLKGIRRFIEEYKKDKDEKADEIIQSQQIGISLNKDGTQTRNALLYLSEEQIKTPKLLLEAHGYDYNLFELVNSKNSMWHQKSNINGLSTLYASKITVKPRTEISLEQVEEFFNRLDRESIKKIPKTSKKYKDESYSECFVLNFFDIHFAKLSHIEETGEEYNYKIAKERMIDSINKYKERFHDRYFQSIYFAIGQDYFNSEPTGATVGNTKQDNDIRYSVMFEKGVEALIDVIEILKDMGETIYIPLVQGNHSTYTEYYAAQFLKAWYRNDEKVIIDASVLPRKYYKFGVNLFGFTHNSEEKNRIYTLMQIESPQEWADTIERTWFTGHLHKEDVKEEGGVFIRQAPTMCSTDAWHKSKGYVGNIKRTQGFIYDSQDGLVESHYIIIK